MSSYDSASEVCVDVNNVVENTESYVDAIETVISSLDQYDNALVSHDQEGYIWKFRYGSVGVFVQLTGITDDDTFTVWSPVLDLPVQNQVELMEKLMQMNWLTTFESRFAIFNNQIVVVATRAVANLSPEEISRSITIVATIADDYDEALLAEFPAAAA